MLHSKTLLLRLPFGQTFMLSILFFCLFYLVAELVVRTKPFQAFFIHQTWDSSHWNFEWQLSLLDRLFQKEGYIDCIFLGNSMVMNGFNPEAFVRGYQSQTGEVLECFNFGVDGMPASNAGSLAKILVQDYQPRLVIYGTDARDYAVPVDDIDTRVLAEMSWLKYKLGQFSPKGWFIEHSEFYRHRIAIQHLLRFDYRYTALSENLTMPHRFGFMPNETVGNVSTPPDPASLNGQIQYYFRLLYSYQIRPENLDGLQLILDQRKKGVQILVVEMPVPPTYKKFFSNGDADYQRFVDKIETLTNNNRVPFLQATSWGFIPEDGWIDYSHLNTKGAAIFSYALGKKVGQSIRQGSFKI